MTQIIGNWSFREKDGKIDCWLYVVDHSDIKEAVNKQAYERFEKKLKSADSVAKAEAEGLSKRFESECICHYFLYLSCILV